MSPEQPDTRRTNRDRVRSFSFALAVFLAWVVGLGVMAYHSSEKPRTVEPTPSSPRPE